MEIFVDVIVYVVFLLSRKNTISTHMPPGLVSAKRDTKTNTRTFRFLFDHFVYSLVCFVVRIKSVSPVPLTIK